MRDRSDPRLNLLVMGPAMIFAAARAKPPRWLQAGMAIAGLVSMANSLDQLLNKRGR